MMAPIEGHAIAKRDLRSPANSPSRHDRISFTSRAAGFKSFSTMKTLLLSLAVLSPLSLTAATVQFDLQGVGGSGLLRTNELHATTGSGSGGEVGGGITFDDVTKILSINVAWGSGAGFSDLTGNATASHIHGPAAQNQNAGVVLNLSSGLTTSATNGGVSYTSPALSAGQEADLLAGLYYINVHTGANGAGELRGNLVVVPEPTVAALGALGLVGLLRRRR